jgi:Uma2 family endonuclease
MGMAALTTLSVQEYLETYHEHAPDYVDGELIERAVPSTNHSSLQVELGALFRANRRQTGLYAYTELHLPVTPTRYRIADLAIFEGPAESPYPQRPALVVVEILSPGQSHDDLMDRLRDCHAWGVPFLWVINPESRTLHRFDGASLIAIDALELPAHHFRLDRDAVFKLLD